MRGFVYFENEISAICRGFCCLDIRIFGGGHSVGFGSSAHLYCDISGDIIGLNSISSFVLRRGYWGSSDFYRNRIVIVGICVQLKAVLGLICRFFAVGYVSRSGAGDGHVILLRGFCYRYGDVAVNGSTADCIFPALFSIRLSASVRFFNGYAIVIVLVFIQFKRVVRAVDKPGSGFLFDVPCAISVKSYAERISGSRYGYYNVALNISDSICPVAVVLQSSCCAIHSG